MSARTFAGPRLDGGPDPPDPGTSYHISEPSGATKRSLLLRSHRLEVERRRGALVKGSKASLR